MRISRHPNMPTVGRDSLEKIEGKLRARSRMLELAMSPEHRRELETQQAAMTANAIKANGKGDLSAHRRWWDCAFALAHLFGLTGQAFERKTNAKQPK